MKENMTPPTADLTDTLVTATAFNGLVRGVAARTTETCREMVRLHDLSPMAAAALGRMATGVQLMSSDLKNDGDLITAIVKGDGPLRGMTVICGPDAFVKGYAWEPVIETLHKKPGKLDVGAAVGKGTLTIISDTGSGDPYMGNIELVSGEIAEDFAAYHTYSEQIPTAVGLGVKMGGNGVSHAGGFRVQLMQGADDDLARHMQERVAEFPEVTWWLEEGFTPRQILDLLFGDPDIQYHEEHPCGYRCDCDRARMERSLVTLGHEELENLAEDPDGIELTCHFCNTRYQFTGDRIRALIEDS